MTLTESVGLLGEALSLAAGALGAGHATDLDDGTVMHEYATQADEGRAASAVPGAVDALCGLQARAAQCVARAALLGV